MGPSGIYPGLLLMFVYMTFMDPLNEKTHDIIPDARDLASEQKLVKYVASRPGPVWVPAHTHTCYMAKLQLCFNQIAVSDWKALHKRIPKAIERGVMKHEVPTIVFDAFPNWFVGPLRRELLRAYECKDNRLKWPPKAAVPVTGWRTRANKICELKPDKKRARRTAP